MSDLHLEVGQQYSEFNIVSQAPYLVLAGDIGRLKDYQPYLEFLQRQCESFTIVFLVLGNHEFYGISRAGGLELARRLEKEPGCRNRLRVLTQTRVDLDDLNITVLGCTLHSNIPTDARLTVHMKVSDFEHIEKWTIDDHNTEHERDVSWLRQEVSSIRDNAPQRKVLVITHHAPTVKGASKPADVGSPVSSAFATEVLSQEFAGVNCWIFGHTHFTTEFRRRGIHLVSNQRGYVLNGIALQGQKTTTPRAVQFRRLLGMKGRNDKAFDIHRVVEL